MTPQAAADWAINNGLGFVCRDLLEKFAGHCIDGTAAAIRTCPQCKGRGKWVAPYTNFYTTKCLPCNGTGQRTISDIDLKWTQ